MHRLGLIATLLFAAMTQARASHAAEERWVVVYSATPSIEAFRPYKLIVLDSVHHPPLRPLLEQRKTVIGYISLGEVEQHRSHYAAVERDGILLDRNPNWPDSRLVDVRDPRWTRRVVEELVPRILHKGFHGIFIDTLDNPADLERRDAARFKGMTAAAANLVKAIRRHYPAIYIMVNRAYEILPEIDGEIDAVLGESVRSEIDFAANIYRRTDPSSYGKQVEWLNAARRRRPALKIYTLDYWRADDLAGIARLYAEQRKNGFIPYVATRQLDRIVPEPGP
jgi:uncharacterized protein (TIGR01370 family)